MSDTTHPSIYWLNEDSRQFLSRGYLLEGETPEQRIRDIAECAGKILKDPSFADKFESYMHRGFYSLASPVWSNFGRHRGAPISCFGSYIEDDMDSIMDKLSEVAIMTKMGGGTSAYFGEIRGRGKPISSGGTSTGAVHFMELYEKLMSVVSQGNVRRGSMAAYLPIDHTDIEEFLRARNPGSAIQDLSIGVCVSDEWMKKLLSRDSETCRIWALVIRKRMETGYPYISFTDTLNRNAPQVYKDKGKKIHHQNLCNEIALSNDAKESFVCCLSSLNLDRWDEMKDTDAVETMIAFLDAVMEEFIQKTAGDKHMASAREFAINQRALGLGVLGWHTYLQSKMIPFESMEASLINVEIWHTIRERADKATEELARIYGEPPLLQGYGRRNTTTLAIAPTTSSSFILGQVSPSIEPLNSNYFVKNLAKGNFTYRNPLLLQLLEKIGQNTSETWKSILVHGGSVQHLDFLDQNQKDTFKTFGEISQKAIISQAAERQVFIDQGQSLNLMIPPTASPKEINQLLIYAWESGVKGLYYQRSSNPSQMLARSLMTCQSCEG